MNYYEKAKWQTAIIALYDLYENQNLQPKISGMPVNTVAGCLTVAQFRVIAWCFV